MVVRELLLKRQFSPLAFQKRDNEHYKECMPGNADFIPVCLH